MQVETTSGDAPDAATATIDPRGEPVPINMPGSATEPVDEPKATGEGAEVEVDEPELTPREKELQEKLEAVQRDKDNAEKAAKSKQRRIDRLTREGYGQQPQSQQASQGQEGQELTQQQLNDRIEQRANEIAQQNEFVGHCNKVFDKALKIDKSFNGAYQELIQEIGPTFDQQGKPSAMMSAILDADAPEKVLVHLTENRDLAAEIADMTPRQQIRRIALLENELDDAAAAKQKPKQPSGAPKPATPVKAVTSGDEPDPNDAKRWIEWDLKRDLAKRKG